MDDRVYVIRPDWHLQIRGADGPFHYVISNQEDTASDSAWAIEADHPWSTLSTLSNIAFTRTSTAAAAHQPTKGGYKIGVAVTIDIYYGFTVPRAIGS